MVLRGSAVAPPSLQDAELQLQKAEERLVAVREELEHAKRSALLELDADKIRSMSKEELVELVAQLKSKVIALERTERKASDALVTMKVEVQKAVSSFGCGGAAGAIARTTVAPIDMIKIKMQTSFLQGTESKYTSIVGTARQIVKDEGVLRLWRGNLTNCIRVVPHTAIQFSSYDMIKGMLVGDQTQMSVPLRLTAGALSGMAAATFTHPMDVIRIRLQTQPELRGMLDATRSVYAENGLRTFYKGYTPAIISLSPFIAINFATFDTLKTLYFGDKKFSKKELQARSPFAILGLGAAAGIIAQTACYPLDTVRRRMQIAGKHYTSTANAFVTIAQQEGMRGFYKGMSANALKVVPNNAIRFAAYELLKSYFMQEEQMKKAASQWSSRRDVAVSKQPKGDGAGLAAA